MKASKKIFYFLFVVGIPFFGISQITTKKVSFPAGKSSTTINAAIKGDQTIDYVVTANAGQVLNVKLTTKSTSLYFNVLPPGSNDEAIFIGSNEGNSFGRTLNTSGSYKIRVYLYRSAARKGVSANYSLSISAKGGASTSSSDAKVSGTNYNATGNLRAATGGNSTSATFGVIRSSGGKAEVHAKISGGLSRVFVFSQGEWSCKSENCKLNFAKIGADEWELIVNEYEKYYIPDAVIYGG
jgi:hypothetical protein